MMVFILVGWLSPDRSTYQEYVLVYADLMAKVSASTIIASLSNLYL